MGEMRVKRENERNKLRKRNESLVKFRVPWQFCIAKND